MLLSPWQSTLTRSLAFTGKGLHSGRVVRMSIMPAAADTGIVFSRTDQNGSGLIPAHIDCVSPSKLCTTLMLAARSIATVEHLLAAFAGLGLHNAHVIVDGPELPIMDGSAWPFAAALMEAGAVSQPARAKAYRLLRPLTLVEGDKHLHLEPAERQRIKNSIEFRPKIIGTQMLDYQESLEGFLSLARARTFCHLSDIEAMHEQGLALGGSLENAIVVADDRVLNEGGLRMADEFVRHKLLDLIGDFALLGAPLLADISAHKTGHALHARCLSLLLSQKDYYLEAFYPEAAPGSGAPLWNQVRDLSDRALHLA